MSDVEWARLEDAPVKEKFGRTMYLVRFLS